jgi:cysteate synthase
MGKHDVRCVGCGSVQKPYALSCNKGDGSLLRAYYAQKMLRIKDLPGIWKFLDWLPVQGATPGTGEGSVTYRSSALAGELGIKNLFISFSGYWPERGARMTTCSFKDLEAPPTVQRCIESSDGKRLVIASAGNTARAFAQVGSIAGLPVVLVVPEVALHRLWITAQPGDITLIGVRGDYTDAIGIAEKISGLDGYGSEGGARNIARRDGMGTVMLQAVQTTGKLPDHYFQAVGSGTGGIAAWEASMRLIEDGRFGSKLPRLHLAQNLPNAPIYAAWAGYELGMCKPEEMFDDVLFNRKPPYHVRGGVLDALLDCGGKVYGVTNKEAADAKSLFEGSEEIDIFNAAAVAVAALIRACSLEKISPDETVLLNITGGGLSRLREDLVQVQLKPDVLVSGPDEAIDFLEG